MSYDRCYCNVCRCTTPIRGVKTFSLTREAVYGRIYLTYRFPCSSCGSKLTMTLSPSTTLGPGFKMALNTKTNYSAKLILHWAKTECMS